MHCILCMYYWKQKKEEIVCTWATRAERQCEIRLLVSHCRAYKRARLLADEARVCCIMPGLVCCMPYIYDGKNRPVCVKHGRHGINERLGALYPYCNGIIFGMPIKIQCARAIFPASHKVLKDTRTFSRVYMYICDGQKLQATARSWSKWDISCLSRMFH